MSDGYTQEQVDAMNALVLHDLAADDKVTDEVIACLRLPADSAFDLLGARDHNDRTALHVACQRGHRQSALALIAAGMKIDAVGNVGQTALQEACASGNVELVLDLLQAGANAFTIDAFGRGPLYTAAACGNVPIIRALVNAGLDVNKSNSTRITPLHAAAMASAGGPEAVETLVGLGASIHAVNSCRQTPLHLAMLSDKPATACALIDLGASHLMRDVNELTPLDVGRSDCVATVRAYLSARAARNACAIAIQAAHTLMAGAPGGVSALG